MHTGRQNGDAYPHKSDHCWELIRNNPSFFQSVDRKSRSILIETLEDTFIIRREAFFGEDWKN